MKQRIEMQLNNYKDLLEYIILNFIDYNEVIRIDGYNINGNYRNKFR